MSRRDRILAWLGLATLKKLRYEEQERAAAEDYAKAVTEHARDEGALIIGANRTILSNNLFHGAVIVPRGLKGIHIQGCVFDRNIPAADPTLPPPEVES